MKDMNLKINIPVNKEEIIFIESMNRRNYKGICGGDVTEANIPIINQRGVV